MKTRSTIITLKPARNRQRFPVLKVLMTPAHNCEFRATETPTSISVEFVILNPRDLTEDEIETLLRELHFAYYGDPRGWGLYYPPEVESRHPNVGSADSAMAEARTRLASRMENIRLLEAGFFDDEDRGPDPALYGGAWDGFDSQLDTRPFPFEWPRADRRVAPWAPSQRKWKEA